MNKKYAIFKLVKNIYQNDKFDRVLDDILNELYKKMTTLQLVPIHIVENYFGIESFDMLSPTDIIKYEYNDHFILFDEYFVGKEIVYYFDVDVVVYRVSVFYDDLTHQYKDFVEISYFGDCPKWLNEYKDNTFESRYK